MGKRNTRISGALLLVVVSLILASAACYSGQIPGVLELTPYQTQEPLPTPLADRTDFKVGDVALAPPETNRAFFNLTVFPEPLVDSLVNSKEMCQPNSTAEVLYAGVDKNQKLYYLIDCSGSVGWVEAGRILGPLNFSKGDLALTVVPEGVRNVQMLDPVTFQPMLLQQCQPGTITNILEIEARDLDEDGRTEIYYQIECPVGTPGWVTSRELTGPLEIRVKDRALAISDVGSEDGEYRLANEPAPLTVQNAVEGSCPEGSILEAQEARPVEGTVYYRMKCGDIEGWVDQDRFVGPLLYDADTNGMIYVPPVYLFEDQLPEDAQAELAATESEGGEDAVAQESEAESSEGDTEQRKVVAYTPPLSLSENPGPAPEGQEAVIVGECPSGALAHLNEYRGLDTIYYNITCTSNVCQDERVDEDGQTVCDSYQSYTGWVSQQYIQGPVTFVPGDAVKFIDSSKAWDEDKVFVRIPTTFTGAATLGRFTDYSGRCPSDAAIAVIDVGIEKDATRNSFKFYYKVQCTGETASTTYVTDSYGKVRPEISYNSGETADIVGWALARDLEPVQQ